MPISRGAPRSTVIQWLAWQGAGEGDAGGQLRAGHVPEWRPSGAPGLCNRAHREGDGRHPWQTPLKAPLRDR